jgi:hypothetical protein
MLCESCGSIDVVRTRSSKFDKVVRFFTNRKRFTCRRCGWSALRAWHVPPSASAGPRLAQPEEGRRSLEEDFDINRFD